MELLKRRELLVVQRILQLFLFRAAIRLPVQPPEESHRSNEAGDHGGRLEEALAVGPNDVLQHRVFLDSGVDAGGELRGSQREAVEQCVEHHAGDEAAGLHGQQPDHQSHRGGGNLLLQDEVGHAERDRRDGDGPPLVAKVSQSGKHEAAEGEFLANGREECHQHKRQPPVWRVIERLLQPRDLLSHFFGVRIEFLNPLAKLLGEREHQYCEQRSHDDVRAASAAGRGASS